MKKYFRNKKPNFIHSEAKDVSGNYSIQKLINNNSNNSAIFNFMEEKDLQVKK